MVFYSPLDRILVHQRVTPQQYIYKTGWRETKWSKVSCLRNQRDGRGLNPGPPDPEFEVLTTRPHTPPQGGVETIQSTFRSPEMYSKRHYITCICLVILGKFESVQNYKGFGIIFSKNFRCNLTYYESENFSESSFHHIFETENFTFPFVYEKSPNQRSEMWKIKLQKIKGDLLDKLQIHEHECQII